uniref:Immunoglobulin like and fibronectin type III domain containing 1, tandem duplicate 4 n=1 Tax=Cyclopterus lumpus TaxID=8103 RepID=A0A8C3A0K6_CYCLU
MPTVGIKKKSRVPVVMITQFIEPPQGKSHPDFTRKPIALTIQEGKFACYKAIVVGDPQPTVTWSRNNGDVSDTSIYQSKYDPHSNEHTFEVSEKGLSNEKVGCVPKYVCRSSFFFFFSFIPSNIRPKPEQVERKEGEVHPKLWELLISSEKKDYENLCAEFGVTDFRHMLKKLNEMKKEREEEQAEFVSNLSNRKHIEVNADGTAAFEIDMDLIEQSSSIFLYKDGVMMKHGLKRVGNKYIFSMEGPHARLYQLDVEGVKVFSTHFKSKEKTVFECVLSNPFSKGLCDCDGSWFKDGEQLNSGAEVTMSKDGTSHKLTIQSCKDADCGVYCFLSGDHSTQGKVIIGGAPEFDSDDVLKFSKPVIIRVGQNAAFRMLFPHQESLVVSWFNDGTEIKDGGGVKIVREPNHSRVLLRDCLRTDTGEIKISKTHLRLWRPHLSLLCLHHIYIATFEMQQAGQALWTKVGDVSGGKTSFRDKNVTHGKKYNYRIYTENPEGLSDALETADSIMAGIMILAGPPGGPTVVSASKTCINLTWTPPVDDKGVPIIGYQLEKRLKDTNLWIPLNALNEPIEGAIYAVKEVTEGAEYEFRVSAINESGSGDPSPPSAMVCAKKPQQPCFKDPEDFMVFRAGNIGEPPPQITWLKDDEPIPPWINIINTEGISQLVIPSSKHSDSGIYTIQAKNSVGEASFDIEVRMNPKQTVQGKVALSWNSFSRRGARRPPLLRGVSMRLQHQSVEERSRPLFTNTYTVNHLLPGVQYDFRIYAKNDMGLSDPSESPTWGVNCNRVPMTPNGGNSSGISFERPPSILVPLKVHTPPKGYKLYMTCAVRGCPTPTVSWYLNDVCINFDNNYYITNSLGECSMYIVAVNSFGQTEGSTKIIVRGKVQLEM